MALYTNEIEQLVKLDSIARRDFAGVFPADRLPKIKQLPVGLVINLDDSTQPGSHWVGMWVSRTGSAIYFDSYGLPPLRPSIVAYIERFYWEHNRKRFQHLTSEDCGYYTILFILLASRGFPLDKIQFLFYENFGKHNDILVKDYIKYILE